ncbi:unnamed protein product, partial [Ilex paraguariensis]
MAIGAPKLTSGPLSVPSHPHHHKPSLLPIITSIKPSFRRFSLSTSRRKIVCKATEVSVTEESLAPGDSGGGDDGRNWVPVVPLAALPRGERRVIIQDGETILLLWYKDEVFAIENRSPAEGAYSEGLLNAKLTQ